MARTKSAGDELVTLDRRSKERRTEKAPVRNEGPAAAAEKTTPASNKRTQPDRRSGDPMPESMAKLIAEEKRKVKVQRRRQIDPTTCERDYSDDEILFMQAMDEYKRKNGRMFPTCSEILEVVRSIGYVKVASGPFAAPTSDAE
jgi:hypothetical protein